MHILLTGANGFIGQHLYTHLIRAGHRVTAAVRNPQTFTALHPGSRTIEVDFNQPLTASDWQPLLADIDVVINAVGIIRETAAQTFEAIHHRAPAALFDACNRARISKVIQISALGADDSATSHYHISKRSADACLQETSLNWIIFRPSIVYGAGAKSTEFFQALSALPVTPVIGDGSQLIQPIHIDDLAKAVLISIDHQSLHHTVIDAVGPSPIAFRDYLQYQRHWLGLDRIRTLSFNSELTSRLLKTVAGLDLGPVNSETIDMLNQGNTASVTPFEKQLGFTPRSVDSHLSSQPSQRADRWHASLYFFPWMLRYSIAFVWLFTGLCSLGLYPLHLSFEILYEAGIGGTLASIALFGGGILDLCLGLAMLNQRYLRLALICQLLITFVYTLIISALLPELWLHPFGPVTKNIPLLAATVCLLSMIRRQ